jgi:hypothetical protein
MSILILLATFAQVGLGCLQAINVVEDRRLWAAATSIAQALTALTLYKYAARIDSTEAVLAFVVGGLLGGQLAMHIGRRRRIR